MTTQSYPPAYQAALEGAAFIESSAGILRISGETCLDYLQRQTTNDIRLTQNSQVLLTVLTSPTARILDVFYMLRNGENSFDLITMPGRAADLLKYLKSRIFFMDRVTVADASQEYIQVDVCGPRAAETISAMGLQGVPAHGTLMTGKIFGGETLAFAQNEHLGLGYRLIAPSAGKQELIASLQSCGAVPLEPEVFEILRVESGLPAAGHELTEEFTPLETGLESAISTAKGCYTGQEVIARQINYDKVTRRIAGLRLEVIVPEEAAIQADGKPAGKISSTAVSPRFGPIALAVLRKPYFEAGTRVAIELTGTAEGQANPVNGQVSSLPFNK